MTKHWWLRAFLIVTGILSLILGGIGAFVPLLPTTPFLLLSAACFIRSSDKLYNWLINNRLFGSYIRNYREHNAMTLKAKVMALLLLWIVIGNSAWFATTSLWLRLLLLAIAIGVTVHLLLLKTMQVYEGNISEKS